MGGGGGGSRYRAGGRGCYEEKGGEGEVGANMKGEGGRKRKRERGR